MDLLQETFADQFDRPGHSARVFAGRVAVRATPALQARVARLIDFLRGLR